MLVLQASAYAQTKLSPWRNNLTSGEYQISEKIILETDREIYMAGEKINISCFTFEPLLQDILKLSKIVYIEFFTSRNLLIEQIKIEMNQGNGSGYIEIPKRLLSGKYYLRAYTNYMKNYGLSGFSYSSVTVLNPFFEVSQDDRSSSLTSVLQKCTLYPEGGYVIYEHSNTIVCKFTSNSGHPVACIARVLDEHDRVISTFSTNAYGLGSFQFTPVPGSSYRVEAAAGAKIIMQEIEIPDQAVMLNIRKDEDVLHFSFPKHGIVEFPLRLKLVFPNASVLISGINENDSLISIATKSLPKGIVHFQLQNSRNEMLSFRNVYIPPEENTNCQLLTGKKRYGFRETLTLDVENKMEIANNTMMSISVFLIEVGCIEDYIKFDREEYLLSVLFPYLAGSHFPASKVINDSLFLEQILMAKSLDEMVIERNFGSEYNKLIFFPEIKKDMIFGSVSDDEDMAVGNSILIQSWIDSVSFMQTTRTNEEGKFFFASDREGENEMIIAHSKYAKGNIQLQDEFFPEFFPLTEEKITLNSAYKNVLEQQMLNLQISDSYSERKHNNGTKTETPFYVAPDKIFFIDDYIALSTLEEFLFEVVPDILPFKSKGKTVIRLPSPKTDVGFGDDPLYLVDGIPVFDADLIADLQCADLLSVGIVYEKYFYQNETFDGIIDIHSRTGNASILELPETIHSVHFTGIQQMNNEDLCLIPEADSRLPYFRTQLYWNPSVRPDENGKVRINFITPDNAGDYLIRCGLKTADGSVMYYYTSFSVDGS